MREELRKLIKEVAAGVITEQEAIAKMDWLLVNECAKGVVNFVVPMETR